MFNLFFKKMIFVLFCFVSVEAISEICRFELDESVLMMKDVAKNSLVFVFIYLFIFVFMKNGLNYLPTSFC